MFIKYSKDARGGAQENFIGSTLVVSCVFRCAFVAGRLGARCVFERWVDAVFGRIGVMERRGRKTFEGCLCRCSMGVSGHFLDCGVQRTLGCSPVRGARRAAWVFCVKIVPVQVKDWKLN